MTNGRGIDADVSLTEEGVECDDAHDEVNNSRAAISKAFLIWNPGRVAGGPSAA